MHKKSVKINYMYNMFYQLLTIIIPLITTPYLSRILGVENIGIFSYTLSIVSYFIMMSILGTDFYGQRETAYQQENKENMSKIFYEIQFIKLFSLIFVSSIYIIFFCLNNKYNLYFSIMFVELVSNYLDISWFYRGIENFKNIVLKNTIVKLISLLLIFTFVKSDSDLLIYFCIYVFSNLFGNLSMWINLHKYIDRKKIKELNVRKHIIPIFSLLLPQMTMQIYKMLDKTMIGALTKNMVEVGYYEQAQKIVSLAVTIITAYSTVIYSKMALSYSKKNNEELKSTMTNSILFILFLSIPITFGICGIASDFVPWFFGNEYLKVINLLILFSPIVICVSMTNLIGNRYLVITNRQSILTKIVIFTSVTNIIINYLLIPSYLSIGAVIGSIISEGIVLILQFMYIKNEVNYKQIFVNMIKYLISSSIMLIVVLLLNSLLEASILSSIIEIIIGFIVYLLFLRLLKEKFIMNIIYTEIKKVGDFICQKMKK